MDKYIKYTEFVVNYYRFNHEVHECSLSKYRDGYVNVIASLCDHSGDYVGDTNVYQENLPQMLVYWEDKIRKLSDTLLLVGLSIAVLQIDLISLI